VATQPHAALAAAVVAAARPGLDAPTVAVLAAAVRASAQVEFISGAVAVQTDDPAGLAELILSRFPRTAEGTTPQGLLMLVRSYLRRVNTRCLGEPGHRPSG